MLESELVQESVRGAAEDKGLAEGVQPGTAAQQFGVPDTGGVCARNGRRTRLWKRRWLRHLGKRCAFPTFPQPRRRRPLFQRDLSNWKCRSMTCADLGGRSR